MKMEKYPGHIKEIKAISVAIDSFDDIFSDFDPSPLTQRTLSEDFIHELRKRYRETKRGSYAITIYAPHSLKDEKAERMVIKRLKEYFNFRALQSKKQLGAIRLRGFIFAAGGILSLGVLILLTYYKLLSQLGIELIGIVLMPLGWFGIWEGFSKMIDTSPVLRVDEDLFIKLSKASYNFKYIE